jgi:drug/metabolite transporter (DMT)-like permease
MGLAVLGWPRRGAIVADWSPVVLGLAAGAGFAVASNAYRQGALALAHGEALLAAQVTVVTVQAMQSAVLLAMMIAFDRRRLRLALGAWRTSVLAGFFGAAASGLWFTAFALAPAGPVRAVGAVETPLAALVGRRIFAERLAPWRIAVALITAAGVVLAALG